MREVQRQIRPGHDGPAEEKARWLDFSVTGGVQWSFLNGAWERAPGVQEAGVPATQVCN